MVSPQHNISDRLKSFSSKHSVCVECGAENPALLYVLGNAVIDLAACRKCGADVDKYLEYDAVLQSIDLALLKVGAFRHFIFNTSYLFKLSWRLLLIYTVCAGYASWLNASNQPFAPSAQPTCTASDPFSQLPSQPIPTSLPANGSIWWAILRLARQHVLPALVSLDELLALGLLSNASAAQDATQDATALYRRPAHADWNCLAPLDRPDASDSAAADGEQQLPLIRAIHQLTLYAHVLIALSRWLVFLLCYLLVLSALGVNTFRHWRLCAGGLVFSAFSELLGSALVLSPRWARFASHVALYRSLCAAQCSRALLSSLSNRRRLPASIGAALAVCGAHALYALLDSLALPSVDAFLVGSQRLQTQLELDSRGAS